jgi:hypothetical protein
MTMQDDVFELVPDSEAKAIWTPPVSEADKVWVDRIGGIDVGKSFKIRRPEMETQRQFKKRINRAAASSFRTLEWKALDTNLPDGVEARNFVAKVKAIDLKAKAEHEARAAASQNGQNAPQTPQEAPETPSEGEQAPSAQTPPEAAGAARRGR